MCKNNIVLSTLLQSCWHKWAASWQIQQNGMCAQSDQSLRWAHEETFGP